MHFEFELSNFLGFRISCFVLQTTIVMLLWTSIGLSVFLSLSAKLLADAYLHERVAILGSFAGLRYTLNPHVAFSLNFGSWEAPLIGVALVAIVVTALRTARTTSAQIGYGMIVGGALGNVLDRLGDGVVTDFIQVGTFPVFNVADSCITVGVLFLLLEAWREWREKRKVAGQ